MFDIEFVTTLTALILAALSVLWLLLWWIVSDIERTDAMDEDIRRWLDEGRG